MPYKNPIVRRLKNAEANKRWYQRNKEKHMAGTAANKRNARALWAEFKATQDCFHCGFSHPAVIDFHHVIRGKGKRAVNELAKSGAYAQALEEIKKCIPLCANCHRILHWQERIDAKKAGKLRRRRKKVAKMRHGHFARAR